MRILRLLSILLPVLLFHSPDARADGESPFVFQQTTLDFGNIRETDGPASGTFWFRNRSDRPVQIDFVATSCGCTTADYPTRPVQPGEDCEIVVKFNPANMSGKVYRDVTVVTKTSEDRLVITADVEPAPVGPEQTYPGIVGGGIRSRDLSYRFGYAAQGRSQSQSITLYNSNDKTVLLKAESSNPHLTVKCPYSLKPGAADGMTVTYDIPVGASNYGICDDTITLYVDGVKTEHPIRLNAIMVDDLDRSDKDAPSMRTDPSYMTLKDVRKGKTVKKQFVIYNDGRKDLIIRHVKTSGGISSTLKAGDTVKPGKSITVDVRLTAPKTATTTQESIFFITNDPLRPQKEIVIRANTK
ncbi:MAG: DUF1573 domain-containing protein [Bacteroidales bacterium]|nr:DUF1573 domain-containing protein [Bacteroidales bacterium]